jgi:hypothetical protein
MCTIFMPRAISACLPIRASAGEVPISYKRGWSEAREGVVQGLALGQDLSFEYDSHSAPSIGSRARTHADRSGLSLFGQETMCDAGWRLDSSTPFTILPFVFCFQEFRFAI